MLTTSYPSESNVSRGIFVYNLVKSLEKLNVEVEVLTPKKYASLTKDAGIFPNLANSRFAWFQLFLYSISFYFAILRRAKNFDLIHANWALTGLLALLSKPFHNKKIVLTERSPKLVFSNNWFFCTILKYVYRKVNRLVVISKESQLEIFRKYKLNPEIIINGVQRLKIKTNNLRKKLGLFSNAKVVLFVGRLTSVKGVEYLIRGISKAKVEHKKLLIVGSGEQEVYLKRLTKELNLGREVVFVGSVSQQTVYRYMAAADILVLPSLFETGGNAILEAAACGLPAIVTKVGWATDGITEGVNGFFIEKQNAEDIAKKLELSLNDGKLLAKMKKNAKQLAKQLISWEECAKTYKEQYEQLINKN